MVEAGQTTVSAGGIWTIVIVMVLLLAFWLAAITLADRSQVRASGRARRAGTGMGAGGLGAAQARESGPGPLAAEIPRQAARAPAGAPGGGADRGAGVPPGEAPTRVDLPAQRPGDADRAARSYAGPDDDRDEAPRH